MEADQERARVIYTGAYDSGAEGDDRLVQVCNVVRGVFDKAGFIDEKRELRIHVTVLKSSTRLRFNATQLLNSHEDLSLGTCHIGLAIV
ncbi:hypothetical protein GGI21_002966 [Coemansia aciculifera]|nr:hypothetical protein GGI21_002966 [Coemansia aciculifera]